MQHGRRETAVLRKYYSPIRLQTVQFRYLDTWNVFKECGEGGVGGYSSAQCTVYCMTQLLLRVIKTLITYITVNVPAPDVQNSKAIVS